MPPPPPHNSMVPPSCTQLETTLGVQAKGQQIAGRTSKAYLRVTVTTRQLNGGAMRQWRYKSARGPKAPESLRSARAAVNNMPIIRKLARPPSPFDACRNGLSDEPTRSEHSIVTHSQPLTLPPSPFFSRFWCVHKSTPFEKKEKREQSMCSLRKKNERINNNYKISSKNGSRTNFLQECLPLG